MYLLLLQSWCEKIRINKRYKYVLGKSEIVCPTNHPFDLFQSSQGARQNPLNHSKDGSSPESKQHSSILCVPKTELQQFTAKQFPVITTGISLCSNSHREIPVMNTGSQ